MSAAQRMADPARINALISSAYNLHVGGHGDDPMTPSRAADLNSSVRKNLILTLMHQGGCDLYDAADCAAALAKVSA